MCLIRSIHILLGTTTYPNYLNSCLRKHKVTSYVKPSGTYACHRLQHYKNSSRQQRIYVFRKIIRLNKDYFSKQ